MSASVLLESDFREYIDIYVVAALVIVGFAVAGEVLLNDPTQRHNGYLLIATAVLQAIMHLHSVPNSPLPLIGWLAGPLSAIPFAVVLLRFPGQRLDPLACKWVIFQTSWLVVSRLTFTVPTPERRLGWWPAIPMQPDVASIASIIGNGVVIIGTLLYAGLLIRRIRSSRGMVKHEIVPVLVAAVSTSITIVLHLASVANSRADVDTWIFATDEVGLLVVPVAFVFSAVKMRMARTVVSDLLMQFDYSTGPTDIEGALARTLADPALSLSLWHAADEQWTRADGKPQEPTAGPGQVVIPIRSLDNHPLAMIVTHDSILRHKTLLDATIAATRLALQNTDALAEIKRSRARIAEAGLLERRRIERDLHDGAQQRLLALSMSLDQLRRRAGDEATRGLVETAAVQLQETMKDIRDLARGVHPAVLTQSGLGAAVVSATESLPLPVDVDIPDERWAETTEAAAYFVILEALTNVVKHAKSTRANVLVINAGDHLYLEVADDGKGGADLARGSGLQGLVDRVSALGGTVQIRSPEGGGTCMSASIPCALR